jgi:7,8-dihydroneopterin aldolase/epimerase/oxygenase
VTDKITLTGLKARGHHGVFDVERANGQDFVVDVMLELDLAKAAETDDVLDTVHYGELAGKLIAVIEGEPVNLIETLAERLADVCLEKSKRVTVTVHKPQAPIPHEFTDVAVTITRENG